jgi:hypothetical protein
MRNEFTARTMPDGFFIDTKRWPVNPVWLVFR